MMMRTNVPARGRRWPRTPRSRLAASGVTLAVVAGLTVTAVSSAAASGGHSAPVITVPSGPGAAGNPATAGGWAGGAATTAKPLPQSSTVMLPTGDRVRLDTAPDGAQSATPVPAGTVGGRPRAASTFVEFAWGGDQYVVPDAAVPYLHSTLDPRLFDVSYLARAHLGTAGTGIPVRITYTSRTARPRLPGLRVTRRSGGTADATITTAQAVRLGQLIASQWRAARTGHSGTPAGRLPGISRISLAPRPGLALPASPFSAARTAAKGLPFYTLTLKFTDHDGKPGSFLGFAQNVGNAALFESAGTGTGSESFSVPKGTYSFEFTILTPGSSGSGFDSALVAKPQVTVDADTTVNLDARTAVPYRASTATPVKASVRTDLLGFTRVSATGGSTGRLGPHALTMRLYAVSPNSDPTLFADQLAATPTAPVTQGRFMFDAQAALANAILGGGSQGRDPVYVFDFPHQGSIPSSLTYTVTAADLTTVHSQIHNSPSGCDSSAQDQTDTFVYLSLGGGQWDPAAQFAFQVPTGDRTDYWYSSEPHLDLWQAGLDLLEASSSGTTICPGAVTRRDIVRTISPGEQISEVWNKTPLAPSPLAPSDAGFANAIANPELTVCTACRQDDTGTLNLLPLADSDPSHYSDVSDFVFDGGLYGSRLQFYRNGKLALSSAGFLGSCAGCGELFPMGLELPMLPQAARYRLNWKQNRPGDAAATIDTDWTFRSSPGDPAAALPGTEKCVPDATEPCSFLPLLFVRYNLPLNDDDQAPAGASEPVGFTVTGQQHAPAPAGLSATVSASFDGGKTWTAPQAAVSQGGGRFTTTISQPALASTDKFVALRVTATDSAGNSVTQTIIRAYGLTG